MPDRPFHVAYLSYDGLTDPLGQSQILPYVLGLEAKGFEFTIFSFEKPDVFVARRSLIDTAIAEKKITWIPLQYHKNPPVLSTRLDIFLLNRAVLRAHSKKPFTLIHCRSYITSLIGLRMKRKGGIKFLFDMRGFWADERVEGGLWNLRNPLYRIIYNFFKQKEKQFLREADQVISLTESAKREMISWNLKLSPITVIPTCVDLNLFDPNKIKKESQESLRLKLGLSQMDFVLIYLGSWGTWYLTDEMLKLFDEIREKIDHAKFLIITPDVVNLSGCKHAGDVIVAQANRQVVPLYLSLANLAVFFIRPSYSKKASSATKLGELLAMKIPTITNPGWGDTAFYDFGSLLRLMKPGEPISLDWLTESRQSPPYLDRLSLDYGIKTYHFIYNELLN